MKAIILAAGMGKRLGELTADNTKCMVKVNGVRLIDRMLSQLDRQNLDEIVIVVGYEGKKLIDYISTLNVKTKITFVDNPIYDKTNNIYSLYLAREYLTMDDTLLLESDLIFEDSVIDELVNDERKTLALVDKYESWMDGTVTKIDDDDRIVAFVPGKDFEFADIPYYYKTVNIYKFGRDFSRTHYVPFLEAYSKALGCNEYYEQVLRVLTLLDNAEIRAKRLNKQLWYEIDDIQDLDIACTIFTENQKEKYKLIQSRYGGYWRYPKLIDFCYLVNPYFPPQKMLNEIKANFERLITQYPSGMRVNSLIASKNFGVHQEHIAVGNGAAELIKVVMDRLNGNVGIIRPTFEEYSHRYSDKDIVAFYPQNDNFSYTCDDVMSFFNDKDIRSLILINPDNPTGNFINKENLIRLIDWARSKCIAIIIDESFADFSDEPNISLFDEEILNKYNNLTVIKSISKSYGVPGLRLGILASSDEKMIAEIKKEVSIWNINSFAEFYMQIEEKYKKVYEDALSLFRKERTRFVSLLNEINYIRVIPTQANYVMIELKNGIKAETLCSDFLEKYSLILKDLTSKICGDKQYVRVAVRNSEDNDILINAFKEWNG